MEQPLKLQFDIMYFAPFLTVCLFTLILLVLPALLKTFKKPSYEKNKTPFLTAFVLLGLVYALGYSLMLLCFLAATPKSQPQSSSFLGVYLYDAVIMDSFSVYAQMLILLCCTLVVLLSYRTLNREKLPAAAYYALLLLSTAGALVMTFAYDLLVVFLGLELLSIPLYALCGMRKKEPRALEASLKYLLMGAFASAFFVYGIALVFAATGTTKFSELFSAFYKTPSAKDFLLFAGIAFVTVGLAFKVALVPFHTWVPDVYEGAPTPITAYMATAVKTAGFAPFLRIFLHAFSGLSPYFFTTLALLSVLTMTVGNVVALFQNDFKRMLAYSSIAHAGTLLLGFLVIQPHGLSSMMFYLLAYSFATIGSFAVLVCFSGSRRTSNFSSFSGKSAASPFLSLCAVTFMFSLAGIPPTAGFVGKLLIFSSLVRSDLTPLAVIALINSVVSAFYYLRLPVMLYMQDEHKTTDRDVNLQTADASISSRPSRSELAVVAVCFAGTLFFGVAQSSLVTFLEQSIRFRMP